jgi:hypothetical protein
MTTARIPLPLNALDDRDPLTLDPTKASDLRDIRTLRERVERSPGTTLFAPTPVPGTDPGFGIRVGTFTKATATGVQVVTHSLGTTPKALILYTSGATALDTKANSQHFAVGFSDGTAARDRSVATASRDGVATSNTSRRYAAALLTIIDWGESVTDECVWSAWSSSTFSINWTTASTTAYQIHYIILGEASVTARVTEWTASTSTGNQAQAHSLGATPQLLIHLTGSLTSASNSANARLSLGAMTASDQWGIGYADQDAVGTTNASRRHLASACLVGQTTSGSGNEIDFTGKLVSIDATNFTVDWVNAPAGAYKVATLCIAGLGSVKLGTFTRNDDTPPQSQAVTGVGFQPSGLFLARAKVLATAGGGYNENAPFSLGAADTANQQSAAMISQDAEATSEVSAGSTAAGVSITMHNHGGDIVTKGVLQSFDSDGFTLNWVVAPTSGESDAEGTLISYAALKFATSTQATIGIPRNYTQAHFAAAEKLFMLTTESAFIWNQATEVFDPTSEDYGLTYPARFYIANTQDIVAWSTRGNWYQGTTPMIRQYDGTSFSNLITTPPATIGANIGSRFIVAFNDRILAAYNRYDPLGGTAYTDFPTELRWCRSGQVNNWDTATGSAGLLEILETSNAPLTGAFVLGERCYLTKRREIIEIIATGQLAPVHRQETKVRGAGCIASHSIALGEYQAFFLGADDVYQWDGSNLSAVGGGIYKTLTALIDYQNLDEVQGVVHTTDSEYWLLLGTGDIFIYDYRRDRWFRDNRSNIAAIGIVQVSENVFTTDIDASEFVIMGHFDARSFRVDLTVTTFLGNAIDSYFVTKDFEAQQFAQQRAAPSLLFLNTLWQVNFRSDPSALVEVGSSTDQGLTWNTIEVTTNEEGIGAAHFIVPFAKVRFRFRNYGTGTFRIYGPAGAYEWEESGHNLA